MNSKRYLLFIQAFFAVSSWFKEIKMLFYLNKHFKKFGQHILKWGGRIIWQSQFKNIPFLFPSFKNHLSSNDSKKKNTGWLMIMNQHFKYRWVCLHFRALALLGS
jgi:hypothetical protein